MKLSTADRARLMAKLVTCLNDAAEVLDEAGISAAGLGFEELSGKLAESADFARQDLLGLSGEWAEKFAGGRRSP